MRIIAGRHRGRRLLGPVGRQTTRPITDRVKTALFDRLASADCLEGAVVMDLFAGTGSMGLECLSRGASFVAFVERQRSAVERLRANLSAIGQADQAVVLAVDVLGRALPAMLGRADFSLVFCDPPYRLIEQGPWAGRLLGRLAGLADCCRPGAVLVLRTPEHWQGRAVDGWQAERCCVYGSMALHHYVRA